MKTPNLFLSVALASTIIATPVITHQAPKSLPPDAQYNGPEGWQWKFLSWSGDGCPDFDPANPENVNSTTTRWDLGPLYNTSLSTYWWYIAFPHMRVQLAANETSRLAKSRCDLIIQYDEMTEYGHDIPMDKRTHRLKLHKNGSVVLANYKLDRDVTAEWQVRYTDPETLTTEAQDWGSIEGPLDASNVNDWKKMRMDWLEPLYTDAPYVQPKCGTAMFQIRLDLWLAARKAGVGGKIYSATTSYGGVQLGFSHDWERC